MIYPYVKNIEQLSALAPVIKFKFRKGFLKCLESYAKNLGKNEYELFKKDYSNFKHRINKLHKYGMLTNTRQISEPPNYYRLTDTAIFYLAHEREFLTIDTFRALLQYYSESIIIQSFLSPFFHKKTLVQLTGTHLLAVLIKYMFECTAEVVQYADYLENTRQMGEFLFSWDIFNDKFTHNINENGLFQFRDFLRYRLKLDWVNNAQLKSEDSRTIVLSKGPQILQIKLNESKDEAILSHKGKKWTLNVSSFPDLNGNVLPFSVCAPYGTKKENALKFFSARMDSVIFSMVAKMLAKPLIPQDVKLLSDDRKFLIILKEVKHASDHRYKEIIMNAQMA